MPINRKSLRSYNAVVLLAHKTKNTPPALKE